MGGLVERFQNGYPGPRPDALAVPGCPVAGLFHRVRISDCSLARIQGIDPRRLKEVVGKRQT